MKRCLRVGIAVLLVAAAGLLMAETCLAGWTTEPIDLSGDAGYSLFIETDPAGTPHVAYYTSGDLRYARRTQSGWQQVGTLENADAFALDEAGDPFFVNVVSPEFHPHFNIMLENGLVLSHKLASTRVGDVFLDFDSQNYPQVGYVDTTARQLKHASWNGTTWSTRTVASSPDFQYANTSLVASLDNNDQMHFAWGSFDENVLKYAKPTGATWQVSTPFGSTDAFPYDIDVDASNNVHLAYNVFTGLVSTGGLFYSQHNGSSWSGGRIPGLDGFGGGRSKVVVDDSGAPHLFSYDSTFAGPDKLKHIYQQSGSWVNETIDSYTSGVSGPDEIEAMIDDTGMHVIYSTGNETVHYAFLSTAGSPGDFDGDGDVDGRDFLAWQRNPAVGSLASWQTNYGSSPLSAVSRAVPEPGTLVFACGCVLLWGPGRLRRVAR